ncbi:hypothetical protein [Pseudonocardia sp. NPDC049154]|uniref:hypothetical protein n=1 Tax=Pseudonocardia sp. NPDC049154 TaxID=3155501 RepID=UPI00340B93C1
MAVNVRFEDGPARGQVVRYGYMSVPLPSLFWTDSTSGRGAVYKRVEELPDVTGAWRYRESVHRAG